MMQLDEVIEKLTAQKDDLASRYGAASLFVFGSVARGDAGPESDVDILVEFDRSVGLFKFIELQQTLEQILGCKVDLGTPRSLKLSVQDQVFREAVRVS